MASATVSEMPASPNAVANVRLKSWKRQSESSGIIPFRDSLISLKVSIALPERGAGKTRPLSGFSVAMCLVLRMFMANEGKKIRCASLFFVI